MYDGVIQDLIDELGRLPGIGPKSAQRIAFFLLDSDPEDVRRFASTLTEVKAKVHFCSICGNVTVDTECRICADPRRDLSVICVVEESKDVVAIERTREFRGRYQDRKSTRLNSSHANISYAVFCLKKKKKKLNFLYIIKITVIKINSL